MKKILVVVLSVFVLVFFSGCGKDDSKTKSIKVWFQMAQDTPEGEVYQAQVDRYNAEHSDGIQVEAQFIPRDASGGGYEDKLNAAISSGNLPDVIAIDSPNISSYAKNNIIIPIDEYLGDDVLGDYVGGAISGGTVDGALFALGNSDYTVGLFYNKDIVEDDIVSLDYTNPSLWDNIFSECDRLKTVNSGNKDWVCIDGSFSSDEWAPYAYLPIIRSLGGDIASSDGLEVDGYYNSNTSEDGMLFIRELINKGYMSTSNTGEIQRFTQNNSAFRLDGSWNLGYYASEFTDLNWGFSTYPTINEFDGIPYVSNGSWTFGVTGKSDYAEESAVLITYLTGKEAGVAMHKALGGIPTTFSAQEEISSIVSDEFIVAQEQMTYNSLPRPISPSYPVLSKQFGVALDRTVSSSDDIAKILNETMVPISKDLEQYK